MKLKAGDVFVVRGDTSISYLIRMFGKFWSSDGECSYNHAGIILDSDGTTFESLNKIASYHISQYIGKQILIVRHKKMTKAKYCQGWNAVSHLAGTIYPWWRLFLHAIHLARYLKRSGIPVCSELVGMFENGAGLREVYWGLTPDNLADEWRISKHHSVIFEGVWRG
jgi:hypothetical protein